MVRIPCHHRVVDTVHRQLALLLVNGAAEFVPRVLGHVHERLVVLQGTDTRRQTRIHANQVRRYHLHLHSAIILKFISLNWSYHLLPTTSH